MRLALLLVGIALLCMPKVLGKLVGRLDGREGVSVALGGVFVGSLAIESAFVLAALPRFACCFHDGAVAMHWGPFLVPGRPAVQAAAAVAAVALPAVALRAWKRSRVELQRARVGVGLGARSEFRGVEVVRLPSAVVTAYSIGGRKPQIVISDGLFDLLEPAELQAVLAHEHAHVRLRHGTILRFLACLEAALPPVRGTVSTLRLLLERSADEEAIDADPDRRTSLLDALLKVAGIRTQLGVAAFAHESGVVERAEALLREPHRNTRLRRVADRLAVTGATTCGLAAAGVAVVGLRLLMSALGVCCGL